MSYRYRVHLTLEVRAENMGEAERIVHGILHPRHEIGSIEYTDTEEIDEMPSDAERGGRDAWGFR